MALNLESIGSVGRPVPVPETITPSAAARLTSSSTSSSNGRSVSGAACLTRTSASTLIRSAPICLR